ncbi:MAG: SGNH/GDSL hydrolase family protein, partial [Acidobacteriota bacterium]
MWIFLKRISRTGFLVVLPIILLCLAAMEIGLRGVGRLPSNTTDGIFAPHGNSYRLKKNISKLAKTPVYSCMIYPNEFGFRDRKPGPRSIGSRPYDLFVGESLTFGTGLDYDQTFAGAYARLADERGRDVANLAIGGHYFRDQEEFLHDIMSSVPAKPSRVIICFSPLFVAGFEDGYTDIIIKDGYILEKRHWLVPYVRLTLGNTSAAYCFFRDNIRRIQARVSNYQAKYTRMQLDFFSRDNRLTKPEVIDRLEA